MICKWTAIYSKLKLSKNNKPTKTTSVTKSVSTKMCQWSLMQTTERKSWMIKLTGFHFFPSLKIQFVLFWVFFHWKLVCLSSKKLPLFPFCYANSSHHFAVLSSHVYVSYQIEKFVSIHYSLCWFLAPSVVGIEMNNKWACTLEHL